MDGHSIVSLFIIAPLGNGGGAYLVAKIGAGGSKSNLSGTLFGGVWPPPNWGWPSWGGLWFGRQRGPEKALGLDVVQGEGRQAPLHRLMHRLRDEDPGGGGSGGGGGGRVKASPPSLGNTNPPPLGLEVGGGSALRWERCFRRHERSHERKNEDKWRRRGARRGAGTRGRLWVRCLIKIKRSHFALVGQQQKVHKGSHWMQKKIIMWGGGEEKELGVHLLGLFTELKGVGFARPGV